MGPEQAGMGQGAHALAQITQTLHAAGASRRDVEAKIGQALEALPELERKRVGRYLDSLYKPAPAALVPVSTPEPVLEPSSGRVPPQNLEAEENVLGAILVAPTALDAAAAVLDPADFYRESHATVYRAALTLYNAGEPVDAITLCDRLDQDGTLERVGGRVRIHELANMVPATANVGHWAGIVGEMATLRRLISVGGEIATMGWDRPGETPELAARAQQLTYTITARGNGGFEQAAEGLVATMQQLGDGGAIGGVKTGFRRLDDLTAGLQPGNLILLAARPSVGKSALALAAAWHAAVHHGPVGLVSLEMSRAEITQRLLARLAHVDLHKLRTGGLGQPEWARVYTSAAPIEKAPLFIDDRAATLTDIRASARQLKNRHGLALLIVDYLQLVADAGGRRSDTRNDEVARISRALKLLAVDLDVPILACSQLNRKMEERAEKRPMLSDLRDSGALEQDANVVIFLHRQSVYDKTGDPATELIVAKNRNGPTGDTTIAFVKHEATFTDMAPGIVG